MDDEGVYDDLDLDAETERKRNLISKLLLKVDGKTFRCAGVDSFSMYATFS